MAQLNDTLVNGDLRVNGNIYGIITSAQSAASAEKLTNARNIAASGGVTWSVSFNGTGGVTGNAVVNSVPWSAISSHTAVVDSATTNKFTTPKAVNDAITAAMSTKASFKGPYTARSAIPSADLDKLSIYLIGPSGSGVDKYEEWILTGTTTAQMLQIGDTSTDLSNYAQKNGSYTALSAGYATATNTAQTMKSALSATTATKVQMQAKSDNTWYQSLFASTSTSSIWYDSDAKVQYNPSSNTFSATNLYGTTVSGATISGTNITAATTVRGTNISGTNISGASKTSTIDNLITNAGRTIGNGTITITTAASPSTSQTFTVNQTANSSIVFGTMAFKSSGDYSLTSHNHYLSALNGTGTYFSGTTAAPSALSALTSKSALSAGSASKAVSASGANSSTFALSSNTARNGNFYEPTIGGLPANYNSASTYAVGDKVLTGGYAYSASAAVTTPGSWDTNKGKFAKLSQVTWTITDASITGLYNGLTLWVKIPSYGGSSGSNATMLSINGSAAKQVRINNGNYTTHYGAGTTIPMVYDGTYFQIGDRTDGNNYVAQNRTTSNTAYPLILKYNNSTANLTNTVNFNESLTYNPNTSALVVKNISGVTTITATTFSGNLSGKAADSDKLGGTAAANFIQSGNANAPITAASAKAAPVASHTISSHSDSANFFTGNSAKSACSATSAKNAGTADSSYKVYHSAWNANSARAVVITETASGFSQVGTAAGFTYNPSTKEFKIAASNGEDSVSITPTHLSCTYGELAQPCTAYLSDIIESTSYFTNGSAKSACSATSAKNAGTASYALTVPDSAVSGKTIGTANNAKQVSSTHTGNNANYYLEFIDSTANGYKKLYHNTGLQYNPSAHILYNSGSSATIVNGDSNTITVDKQKFNFINGITNTVSTATNTRITSGVGIFGSNNSALGLKNGAIIGTNIKVSGNNNAGYNISNILFLGDNNAVNNLNQYENAKLIISQGKIWDGTVHGTDVFAIKGGGSVWTNVLKRNTEDLFDCNGHSDSKYNYAPMYKNPVASPTQEQTMHYNLNYNANDNYLVVSRDGFLVPTDITISKTNDSVLGKDAAARMVLINLIAGNGTQGMITVGQDAPGYLNVGTDSTAVVRLGDNYSDVKIGYANSGSYGIVDIGNTGNGYSMLKVFGNETVSALTALTAYIPTLTAANLTATTLSATTVKGVTVSASAGKALTASGNSAKFTTFSGTTFNGGTFSGNLSGIAKSAENVWSQAWTSNEWRPIRFSYNEDGYNSLGFDPKFCYNPSNDRLSAEKLYTKYVHVAESCTEYVTASDVTQIQNPRICFSACEDNDHQQGYLIWSDFDNTNLWTSNDSYYFGGLTDGFVFTSNQGNTIQAVKNFSATNIKSNNTIMSLGKNSYVHAEPTVNTAAKTCDRSLSSTIPAGIWRNTFNAFYYDGASNGLYKTTEFTATAGGAVAIGQNASAVGRNSFSLGSSALAVAPYSYVFAKGGISNSYGQVVVGIFNTTSYYQSKFIVGNGTSDNDRSNAIEIGTMLSSNVPIYCKSNIRTDTTVYGESGRFGDISATTSKFYNLTAQNATAINLEIRPDFWTGAAALKTYANDFTEWYGQTAKYPMGGQSSAGPDGLIRAGRIKQAFFTASAKQSADISFLYSLVKWQGTTWKFKAMCPFAYAKYLIFDFNDLNKSVTVFHNDGCTAISTAQQFKLVFNSNGTPGPSLYFIGQRCVDVTVTLGSNSNEYYMFLNAYD